jgi:phosphatidylinositol alpha-1,6-mannosyltransferase
MPDALMVTSSFLPGRGGIESYLAELCAELKPRLAVIAQAERDGEKLPDDLGYSTLPYDGTMLLPTRRIAQAIVERCRELDTNKVVFGTPWPLVLLAPRLVRAGIAYSVIVHGAEMLVPSAIPILQRRLAAGLAGADLLLPVSRYTADRLRAFLERNALPVPHVDLLRAKVDLERFRPDADDGTTRNRYGIGDGPLVLCFGRLVKRKGVHRAIAAMSEISQRVPGAQLVVAGTGPELRNLQKHALDVDAPIIFLGRVPDADAAALYAGADVFLLPVVDRYRGLEIEGLGVVLLEAGACETPSVTGRSGGTPEAVIDGETGFVIDAADPRALTDAVVRLLSDADLRAGMGRAARKHVAREFSRNRVPGSLLHWLGDVG